MGANESKLKYKNYVYKIADSTRQIPPNSPYWSFFWREPNSAAEIYSLLTNTDIRSLRDANIDQFILLIKIVCHRLIYLSNLKSITWEKFPKTELLNCIRILTRILPFLYEAPEYQIREKELFWSQPKNQPSNDDSQNTHSNPIPLGAKLIFTVMDLLFTTDLTVPSNISKKRETINFANNTDYIIWEPGISQNAKFQEPNTEIDCNRLEILRFLNVLCSQCLYKSISNIIPVGSRYLTVLVTSIEKIEILTFISSLLNLTCRSTKSDTKINGLEFSNSKFKELRTLMVTNAIQLLTLCIVYPLPKLDLKFLIDLKIIESKPINLVRFYCGKLYKDNELELIEHGLLDVLCKPTYETSDSNNSSNNSINGTNTNNNSYSGSYSISNNNNKSITDNSNESSSGFSTAGLTNLVKGTFMSNTQPSIWSVELVFLFWEFYQCNKKFRIYIANKRGPSILLNLLYYIYNYRNNDKYKNFVRVCCYLTLFLSYDPIISRKLVSHFPRDEYNKLPQNFKISTGPTTYRDFITTQTCNMLTIETPMILIPTMVEWLFNVMPLQANQHNHESETSTRSSISTDGTTSEPTMMSNRRSSSSYGDTSLLFNAGTGDNGAKDISLNNSLFLSYQASVSLTTVIHKFSSPQFLKANNINIDLLALVLRSICHSICRYPKQSCILLYVIARNFHAYEAIERTLAKLSDNDDDAIGEPNNNSQQSLTISDNGNNGGYTNSTPNGGAQRQISTASISSVNSSPINKSLYVNDDTIEPLPLDPIKEASVETTNSMVTGNTSTVDNSDDNIEVMKPKLPVGMSIKAKSKVPYNLPLQETWTGSHALTIILNHVRKIRDQLPHINNVEMVTSIQKIHDMDFSEIIENEVPSEYLNNRTEFEPLKFTWSNLSLGWYESVLWGSIYISNETCKQKNFIDFSQPFNAFKKVGQNLSNLGFSKWTSAWSGNNNASGNNNSNARNNGGNGNNNNGNNNNNYNNGNSIESLEEYVDNCTISQSIWEGTRITLFKIRTFNQNGVDTTNQSQGGLPSSMGINGNTRMNKANDLNSESLIRRLSNMNFRNNSVSNPPLNRTNSNISVNSLSSINTTATATNANNTSNGYSVSSPTISAPNSPIFSPNSNLFKNSNPFSNGTILTNNGSNNNSARPSLDRRSSIDSFNSYYNNSNNNNNSNTNNNNNNNSVDDFEDISSFQLKLTPRNTNHPKGSVSGRITPRSDPNTPVLSPVMSNERR
ncbi:unnamed protein product [[Candida] boidinii]|uniref:Unnamed protein product n=1 Tax=Candida boidinii TaxID=5477 RepID=A0ACB5TH90_CANBO|nr:unnamed protein product [[Candida] boidinii]